MYVVLTCEYSYVPVAKWDFYGLGNVMHRRRSSVNFGGQDIFARKYMHEN